MISCALLFAICYPNTVFLVSSGIKAPVRKVSAKPLLPLRSLAACFSIPGKSGVGGGPGSAGGGGGFIFGGEPPIILILNNAVGIHLRC